MFILQGLSAPSASYSSPCGTSMHVLLHHPSASSSSACSSVLWGLSSVGDRGSLPPQYLSIYAFRENQNNFILLVLGICIPAAMTQLVSAFRVPAPAPRLGPTCHILCFHQDGPIPVAPLCDPHTSFGLFGGFQRSGGRFCRICARKIFHQIS